MIRAGIRALSARLWASVHALTGGLDAAPIGWLTSEVAAQRLMRRHLKPHLALAREIEAFAFQAMTDVPPPNETPEILRVHSTLLARTLQDLRATVLLSLRAYTMQAWSAAASAFEAAHAMGFVGKDPSRAERWLEHSQMDRSSFPVKDGVVGTFKYLFSELPPGEREAYAEKEYSFYERLCMGKHVNPVADRDRYWVAAGTSSRLYFTPLMGEPRVKEARLAIALAARSGVFALWILAITHSDGRADPRIVQIAERAAALLTGWNDAAA